VLLLWSPGISSQLAWDRRALADGELWRLITGHLVHFSWNHLGWDLLVFAVLGGIWECSGHRYDLVASSLVAACAISLVVLVLHPDMSSYRGLSGVDSCLVMALVTQSLQRARHAGKYWLCAALLATLLAGLAKVGYELATGGTVFVDAAEAGFVPVPVAHLVGGAVGLVWGLCRGAQGPSASCES